MTPFPSRQILGMRFFTGTAQEAVARGLDGGLVVVPSAPVLLQAQWDAIHRNALVEADLAITDSGAMVLLWFAMTGERLPRTSGLEYLRLLLREAALHEPGATAWVMPSAAARDSSLAWLKSVGFPATPDDCYVAPAYPKAGRIDDPILLEWLQCRQPRHVILCVGGCTQERLGWCLRQRLDLRPGLHGVGAAIGFLTGEQAPIPPWADRLFLGWFIRCLYQPGRFVPRYWAARKLIPLMLRYRSELPPLREANAAPLKHRQAASDGVGKWK